MTSQATLLYRLQTVDLAIDTSNARLHAIKVALESDDRVARAEHDLKSAHEALSPLQTRSRNLDLEIKSLTAKIKATDDRLYSGKVHNPKELGDMQNEIESLKKQVSRLEDEQLETLLDIETKQKTEVEADAAYRAAQQGWRNDEAALQDEQSVLQRELAALIARRKDDASAIEPAILARYDGLRTRKRGQAVAPLNGDSCATCGVEQTSMVAQQVRAGHQIVLCESCGRILAVP